jgi:hypothetical protein
LNPFDGVMVIVPCAPRAIVRLCGEADRLKFGTPAE